MTGAPETPLEIAPEELAAQLADAPGAPILLDVRQPEEHAFVRLEGSRLIPLGELPARLGELAPDAAVVAYCHHGVRSRHAALLLRAHGFAQAQSLAGGIDAWTRLVDPALPRY
jgi:sulfur-carrier protein adenylyltransferase/sulfurtransferase